MKSTPDGRPFLILEEQLEEREERVIGFASPAMLQVLNQSTEWFIDGTWDITKNTMFAQAWVIVARINPGISVPCAFFFLPNKQPASYRAALTAIKDKDVTDPVHVHVGL